jgi:methylphosphotriester-DNA--protein-cysteine methyltransferase
MFLKPPIDLAALVGLGLGNPRTRRERLLRRRARLALTELATRQRLGAVRDALDQTTSEIEDLEEKS